ncbi:hypothetical protein Sjap_008283 [Stephania japonica]|uniref:Delta(3)-Delta(2)-enoyl-CoA isomerase n=1 Tax=Stephania japonica TaxID=461633 RepID=A0AAP0JPV5_9MAGN
MCTLEKRGDVFLLTLTGDNEHRLNPSMINKIRTALHQVRTHAKPGSVLITTAEGKFFCNGLDLAWARAAKSGLRHDCLDRLHLMVNEFRIVVADLISLPLPTIATVTAHAAAAGLMLAISHDYVLMRKDRGVLYMSELDVGTTFPDYFMELMRSKIVLPGARRNVVLRAAKIKPMEALEMGIIDSVHESSAETSEAALRLGDELGSRKWNGEVYSEIRKSSFPELCKVIGLIHKEVFAAKL